MLEPPTLLAGIILVSLSWYTLLGGADYGGGVWDLFATGPTAPRQREVIARAIAPVWEANHVWLIVAVTLLFAGFPGAFARIGTFLHIPLVAALTGIVLRGAAFVFRAYGPDDPRHEWWWGRVFAIASSLTPLVLGIIVGALTEGRLPVSPGTGFADTFVYPWLTPFTLAVGAFTLALFAYLAAVYLTLEADDAEVEAAFRLRAIGAGGARRVARARGDPVRRTGAAQLLRPAAVVALGAADSACRWRMRDHRAPRALDAALFARTHRRRGPGGADPLGVGIRPVSVPGAS